MKLKTLALAVAVLAAAAALVHWRSRQSPADSTADPRIGAALVGRPTLEATRGLSVTIGAQTVTVVADTAGTTWTVPGYFGLPADFGKLSTFIETLQSAKVARCVTANPERLERLGFGGDRIELRDAEGQPLWTLALGRTAETGGRFVRFAEEKKAYLVELDAHLDPTPRNWAKAQLLDLKAEEVAALTLSFGEGPAFACQRAAAGSGWTADGLPAGKEAKASAIDALLGQLTTLRFTESTEPVAPEAVAARAHARTATLTLKDGTVYSIALGRPPAPPQPAVSAVAPAATIEPDGQPQRADPAAISTPLAPPPPTPPPPGPVFAFIASNREEAPVNALMQKRAFQVAEYVLAALPAAPGALLQDRAPPPASAAP